MPACFTLEMNQARVIPEMNPARWPSHETALEVGKIPRTIPPYPRMQTMDKSSVPILRSKKARSEEHTSELQSHSDLVCRLLLEKKKTRKKKITSHRNKLEQA